LPALIELADLAGDLHVHSDRSDGSATIGEMARAAPQRGLRYIAIYDHSRRLAVAHGLDAQRLARQRAEITRIQGEQPPVAILCGFEVDILADGSLDLPAEVLAPLDLVVAAVHSSFALPRERQTERILRALEQPHLDGLTHPLGRWIDEREPYDVDRAAVIRSCAQRRVAREPNAHPERLDLLDT